MNNCNYEEIKYAEDIGGSAGQEVVLPSINNASINWTLVKEGSSSTLGSIRYYSGENPETHDQYWLQFHHVDSGSGVSEGVSGDRGGRICTTSSDCNHVHVEFSSITTGGRVPQDAPLYLCI